MTFPLDGSMSDLCRSAAGPGASPTSISTTQAFLYAPLVYVDSKPQDPSKEYSPRGMTLITITAPSSGPVATRQGDLIIPGTEVAFGGFATLLGRIATDTATDKDKGTRDVYLLGMIASGLQLARVGIDDLNIFDRYTFWDPRGLKFTNSPPKPAVTDYTQVYLPGTFSSGNVFYSPYFKTFIMVYFNKMVDSTFYTRYLNLNDPLSTDKTWITGGKSGNGIEAEDVEALFRYAWSAEQKLYASPPGKGGFNYAGMAHPEYFNRQFFPQSLYPSSTPPTQRSNAWYGSSILSEHDAGADGKNLLLSWTSQRVGGTDTGIYDIRLAMLAFDDIPPNPDGGGVAGGASTTASASPSTTPAREPVSSVFSIIEHGCARQGGASSINWPLLLGGVCMPGLLPLLSLHARRYGGSFRVRGAA